MTDHAARLAVARGLPDAYANGASLDLLTGLICDALGYPNAEALLTAATVRESESTVRDRDQVHGEARYALEVIQAGRGKRGVARKRELAPLRASLERIGTAMVAARGACLHKGRSWMIMPDTWSGFRDGRDGFTSRESALAWAAANKYTVTRETTA